MAASRTIQAAIAAIVHRRFGLTAEGGRTFSWPVPEDLPMQFVSVLRSAFNVQRSTFDVQASVRPDRYLPAPLHCLVFIDDPTHCTRERAALLAAYPADVPLSFDVRRYLADTAPGDPGLAWQDALADLLPPRHGFNPTVRVREDEIVGGSAAPLEDQVAALLANRLAIHAGTTFQGLLDGAGGKPHRTRNA